MSIETSSPEIIAKAAAALSAGELVAFPTETVYGLGALATDDRAVAKIFATKARPQLNPLIVHVYDDAAVQKLAVFSDVARRLATAFWPGPMTLVLAMRQPTSLSPLVTAGNRTVAIRVPAHPIARDLLKAVRQPISAPSANRSGHVSPTTAAHVAEDLGSRVAHIIDGGPTTHGLESTIVDVSGPNPILLRPGSVTAEMLADVLGHDIIINNKKTNTPNAPGQLSSHYAPNASLRLDAETATHGEALLAFGILKAKSTAPVFNLSETGDLVEAAANLFAGLRYLDDQGTDTIAVMAIPNHGLGAAINDRLLRAAAPRT